MVAPQILILLVGVRVPARQPTHEEKTSATSRGFFVIILKSMNVLITGASSGIGEALAREVVRLCEEEKGDFRFSYTDELTIKEKIEAVATKVYGGDGVIFAPQASKQIERLEQLGFGGLPVCIAKTQYSFTDDPTVLGAPEDFTVTIKNVKVSAGAGFIVVLTGDIMTMPGLPKSPAAERIDVDEDGRISGLF